MTNSSISLKKKKSFKSKQKFLRTVKINDQFRLLTDLMLFSDRKDLDFSKYIKLYFLDPKNNFKYFIDKFNKASNICWDNLFWNDRFKIILSLKDKKLVKLVELHIIKNMRNIIRNKKVLDSDYDSEYVQFIEFCKVKKSLNSNLITIKKFMAELPDSTNLVKLDQILKSTTPYVFESFEDYFSFLSKKILRATEIFRMFSGLEKLGHVIDRKPLAELMTNLLSSRFRVKILNPFFNSLKDEKCLQEFKKIYTEECKRKIISLIKFSNHVLLDSNHFLNLKNLLILDPSLADEVVTIYLDKICCRNYTHQKANADKILNLIKAFPFLSSKKILSWLHTNHKKTEIKYLIAAHPNLNKLSLFI